MFPYEGPALTTETGTSSSLKGVMSGNKAKPIIGNDQQKSCGKQNQQQIIHTGIVAGCKIIAQ
jgi:hypothetical protein